MALKIAITAHAVRTALGSDAATVWERVAAGTTAIAPVQGFDGSGFGKPKAAQIWTDADGPEEDPALRILGPHGRLLEAVARSTHDAAQLGRLAPERVGLFVGMGMVDSPIHDLVPAALASRDGQADMQLGAFFQGGYRAIHPLWPLSMLNNVAAGQVSIDLDIRGDNLVLASSADAGMRALLEGARSVQRGDCRAALVAGVSGRITPFTYKRLALQGRSAVTPGEGGAALALAAGEDSESASAHLTGGATAFGSAQDGSGPDAGAWQRAIEAALLEAERPATAVTRVFLHAEGCGEAHEQAALAACGLDATPTVVTKRALGHTGAGAPAIDLTLALAALPGVAGPILILAGGPEGGAGALVVEAA